MNKTNFTTLEQEVPAMPLVDLASITDSESLISALKSLEYTYEYINDATDDIHENTIEQRKVKILTEFFGAGYTSSFMTSGFSLYGKTLEEVLVLKKKAKKLGFKNIQTKDCIWNHGDAHSEYVFRIDVDNNERFQIGDPERQLERLLTIMLPDIMKSLKEHILYTYSYTTDLVYLVDDKKIAELFHERCSKFFDDLHQQSLNHSVKLGRIKIDVSHGLDESKLKFEYIKA